MARWRGWERDRGQSTRRRAGARIIGLGGASGVPGAGHFLWIRALWYMARRGVRSREGPFGAGLSMLWGNRHSRSGHPWRDLFLNDYRKGCACQLDRTESRRPSSEELTGEVAQNAKTAAIARAAREEAWVHFGGNAGARLPVDDNQSGVWPWRGPQGQEHRTTEPFPRRGGGVELQKRRIRAPSPHNARFAPEFHH